MININIQGIIASLSVSWQMIDQALEIIPDHEFTLWYTEWAPNDCLYHIIETNKFYLERDPAKMEWGKRAGIDWKDRSQDEIKRMKMKISKELLKDYLDEIRSDYIPKLETLKLQDFEAKTKFDWFKSYHHQLSYLIRHNMYHLGEIAYFQRIKDYPRLEWK